jgi:hypothetical protein
MDVGCDYFFLNLNCVGGGCNLSNLFYCVCRWAGCCHVRGTKKDSVVLSGFWFLMTVDSHDYDSLLYESYCLYCGELDIDIQRKLNPTGVNQEIQ